MVSFPDCQCAYSDAKSEALVLCYCFFMLKFNSCAVHSDTRQTQNRLSKVESA